MSKNLPDFHTPSKSLKKIISEGKGYAPAYSMDPSHPNRKPNNSKADFKTNSDSIAKLFCKNEQLTRIINHHLEEEMKSNYFNEWDEDDAGRDYNNIKEVSKDRKQTKEDEIALVKPFESTHKEFFKQTRVPVEKNIVSSRKNDHSKNTFENIKHQHPVNSPTPIQKEDESGPPSSLRFYKPKALLSHTLNERVETILPDIIQNTTFPMPPERPNLTVESEFSPKTLAYMKMNNYAIDYIHRVGLSQKKKPIEDYVEYSKQIKKKFNQNIHQMRTAFDHQFAQTNNSPKGDISPVTQSNGHKDGEGEPSFSHRPHILRPQKPVGVKYFTSNPSSPVADKLLPALNTGRKKASGVISVSSNA